MPQTTPKATAEASLRPHPDLERERNRTYDRATEGDPELATASPGGRGIDLLRADLAGNPQEDETDPMALPLDEDDADR